MGASAKETYEKEGELKRKTLLSPRVGKERLANVPKLFSRFPNPSFSSEVESKGRH